MNSIQENETPRPSPSAHATLASRDLDSHGFFLKPLLQPGFDVLDVGCGPATITTGIAEVVFPARVTAVDLCHPQLETARRLTQGREIVNIDFVSASACLLPFPDHSFDVVFAHALLEHLPHPEQSVQEFHRVTRPGGFIALCSADWDHFHFNPQSSRVGRAIQAYRELLRQRGENTRAGAGLGDWLARAGFTPLVHDQWFESYENAAQIANDLAKSLDHAGQFHHATTLRNSAARPGARFSQCWKFATAVRADDSAS